jgi:hypothetical protein
LSASALIQFLSIGSHKSLQTQYLHHGKSYQGKTGDLSRNWTFFSGAKYAVFTGILLLYVP